jgi:hypothetical protein
MDKVVILAVVTATVMANMGNPISTANPTTPKRNRNRNRNMVNNFIPKPNLELPPLLPLALIPMRKQPIRMLLGVDTKTT